MENSESVIGMMSVDEIKSMAAQVAGELAGVSGAVPHDLRTRFVKVRGALFLRGIYDPVLVRFDSATAPPASPREVGEQLAKVAEGL